MACAAGEDLRVVLSSFSMARRSWALGHNPAAMYTRKNATSIPIRVSLDFDPIRQQTLLAVWPRVSLDSDPIRQQALLAVWPPPQSLPASLPPRGCGGHYRVDTASVARVLEVAQEPEDDGV